MIFIGLLLSLLLVLLCNMEQQTETATKTHVVTQWAGERQPASTGADGDKSARFLLATRALR